VTTRIKKKRQSSNPVFDEELFDDDNEKTQEPEEERNFNSEVSSAKRILRGKKFRRNMIRCLNKMRALKITPKEVKIIMRNFLIQV